MTFTRTTTTGTGTGTGTGAGTGPGTGPGTGTGTGPGIGGTMVGSTSLEHMPIGASDEAAASHNIVATILFDGIGASDEAAASHNIVANILFDGIDRCCTARYTWRRSKGARMSCDGSYSMGALWAH